MNFGLVGLVLGAIGLSPMALPAQSSDAPDQASHNEGEGLQSTPLAVQPSVSSVDLLAEKISFKKLARVPIPPEELGIKAGPFQLYPDLNASLAYDNNVYATRTNEVRDWMRTITPSLLGRSESAKYEFNFRTGVAASRYHNTHRQDSDDYWIEAQGTYHLTPRTDIYAGAGYSRNHEDPGSPDLSYGSEPTRYFDTNLFAGVFHDYGLGYFRAGAAGSRLNFNNVPTDVAGVTLINDYRDRNVGNIGGRTGLRIIPHGDVFIQGVAEKRHYLYTPDSSGVTRDSKGYRVAVGAAIKPSQRLEGEAYLGLLRQHYSDASFANISAADMGLSVRWHASPWTTYRFSVDRSLEETTVSGASGYLSTSATGQVEYDLGAGTWVNGGLTVGQNDFQGVKRKDISAQASIGVRHYLNKSVYLGADYRFLRRTSDALQANYYRNLLLFSVGSDFGARRKNRYFAYEERKDRDWKATASSWEGLYLGAQAGLGNLSSTASGLRDATTGNTTQSEMANNGSLLGVFLGYGTQINQWYLGAEIEADKGNARIAHEHTSASEPLSYSVKQKATYGFGLRAGYVMDHGSLLYGRLGAVRTSFANTMVSKDGAYSEEHSPNGLSVGIGAEIPAGNDLFWRFEYRYAKYGSYHVVTPTYDEKYKNSTNYFNAGLGWRFSGPKQQAPAAQVDAQFMNGVYAGAQLGYGNVNSQLYSPSHYHATGNDTLSADFGAANLSSGIFLGYGHTFNRWYLGLELEGEPSQAHWEHDRSTKGNGGRNFSISKKGSYGASLRAGYVLGNGALIYGRIGEMRTKFNTQYERGNSGLIDRDDTLYGTRIGIGAELPINKSAFWRLDYSVTRYGGIPSFSSTGSNADIINLSNRENLFRLGIGVRFY